jgi:calcineurin-like phosphoesterase family protein
MIYLIADTHFGHKNIIEYEDRPFDNIDDMDSELIKKWNSVVDENDLVYHLGDVFLCNTDRQFKIFNQLNGTIHLIRGNHDKQTKTKLVDRLGFESVRGQYQHKGMLLTHKPKEDTGIFNIHGHSHSRRKKDASHFCVSVEENNYTPVSFRRILTYKHAQYFNFR